MICSGQTEKGRTGEECNLKIVLIISFDIKGLVHKEFIVAGKTVNSAHYCDALLRLHEKL
jgi:hypothetical protein